MLASELSCVARPLPPLNFFLVKSLCNAKMETGRVRTTVWPEILVGNLFWRIDGFESNPPIFHPPKLHSVMSALLLVY